MTRAALTTREPAAKQHTNMAPMIIERKSSCHVPSTRRHTDLFADSKRKALDDPGSPSANKRIKNSHPAATEAERKPLKVVPFPEKVCGLSSKFTYRR